MTTLFSDAGAERYLEAIREDHAGPDVDAGSAAGGGGQVR
jgi:hypothetical protein